MRPAPETGATDSSRSPPSNLIELDRSEALHAFRRRRPAAGIRWMGRRRRGRIAPTSRILRAGPPASPTSPAVQWRHRRALRRAESGIQAMGGGSLRRPGGAPLIRGQSLQVSAGLHVTSLYCPSFFLMGPPPNPTTTTSTPPPTPPPSLPPIPSPRPAAAGSPSPSPAAGSSAQQPVRAHTSAHGKWRAAEKHAWRRISPYSEPVHKGMDEHKEIGSGVCVRSRNRI